MATDLAEIHESKCPLCGKLLTNEEYVNVKNELKNQVSEEHKKEIQQLHEVHREEIILLQKDLQGWYSKQIEDLKKTHEEDITKMKEYLKSEQERCMNIYRQEASSKENQLNELRKQIQKSKIEAKAKADTSARAEIDELRREVSERDIQLRRFGNEIEELKKQVIKTQPELKGEAGEANLLAILRNEFRQDLFTPQTRGISGADIIQQIRTPSGDLLKITIGYDNKEADDVNKSDIEKTKRDRDDLMIGYMIIVSRSFPKKEVKNGFLG
jgi:DNA repair exonuclease SbcCD ATPase subunit